MARFEAASVAADWIERTRIEVGTRTVEDLW
jgi:hypothetical protein